MDDLSNRLLKLVSDPNASMEDLITGMNQLTRAIDKENRQHRRQQNIQHRAQVQAASDADLRRLANANLAKKYK